MGYLIPVCFLAFVESGYLKLLSLVGFICSKKYVTIRRMFNFIDFISLTTLYAVSIN